MGKHTAAVVVAVVVVVVVVVQVLRTKTERQEQCKWERQSDRKTDTSIALQSILPYVMEHALHTCMVRRLPDRYRSRWRYVAREILRVDEKSKHLGYEDQRRYCCLYLTEYISHASRVDEKENRRKNNTHYILLLICYYFPCHPTMCTAWSSTLITHNFPERRKPRKQGETHAPSLPPFCANFRLVYSILCYSIF